jgi:ATP-dependent DNA helicase RecG
LDRETNKALLVRHLRESGDDGCPISELQQVLPAQSRDQLKRLLGELRREGRAQLVGERRGARWRVEEGS